MIPQAIKYASKGKDLLKDSRITAYDRKGEVVPTSQIDWQSEAATKLLYKQDPWKENAMGFVKINFYNKHAVFLHDTPSKREFGENFRAQSSGCVRVQNIQQLVAWILKDSDDWNISRIAEVKRLGNREDVKLKKRVPIYLVYLTAWSTNDGTVHFRRDLYSTDEETQVASTY